jgi:hypothetical protein
VRAELRPAPSRSGIFAQELRHEYEDRSEFWQPEGQALPAPGACAADVHLHSSWITSGARVSGLREDYDRLFERVRVVGMSLKIPGWILKKQLQQRREGWSVVVRDGDKVEIYEGLTYIQALGLAIEHNSRALEIASRPGWDHRLSNLPHAEICPPVEMWAKQPYFKKEPKRPEEREAPKSCNRHADCHEANRLAREAGRPMPDHCHDDCCEECFGS